MRKFKGQRGLSLIEVTIMLLVLMLLTSVLAPSIFDFVNDAQLVKVKEDCEAIAVSVARLTKDVGSHLYTEAAGFAGYPNFKMDILISNGTAPFLSAAVLAAPSSGFTAGGLNQWWYTSGAVTVPTLPSNFIGTCDEQLILNEKAGARVYPQPTASQFGPYFGGGWRGAYLSPQCGPDPWGNAYEVNTKWMTQVFGVASPGTVEFHCTDVYCLSAGKNGIIETVFGYAFSPLSFAGTRRTGDDHVTVIAPCDP